MEIIKLQGVSKIYTHYANGIDRLLEIITHRPHHQSFTALHPLDLSVSSGQVLGIIGNNGAGKSTLLKLIANTLHPSQGQREVQGRIAALLELGGGFHPDMTGRENVYLNATMVGLSPTEIEAVYEDIVAFAGIGEFIEQPVKTYSSGMFMRLAFAVATCVEPDILIVDEALSVGDGAFARKSFNRIMQFKEAGKTILFCSHALYQVEAICDRVIWLDKGVVKLDGAPANVVSAYIEAIALENAPVRKDNMVSITTTSTPVAEGTARITEAIVSMDGVSGRQLDAISRQSELCVTVAFVSDLGLLTPSVGLMIVSGDGQAITSAGTQHDGLIIQRDAQGHAKVRVRFAQLALLKGEYRVDVYLLCEKAIHVYDKAEAVAVFRVRQHGLEQGVVSLPRQWAQI